MKPIKIILLGFLFIVVTISVLSVLHEKEVPENQVAQGDEENLEQEQQGTRFDRDQDGVRNIRDNCPNTYNPEQLDQDNDGIGDACTDAQDDSSAGVVSGTREGSMQHDGELRNYFVHIPKGYSPEATYPLVFLLHGGEGNAASFLEQTNMTAKADAESFILVAPNALDGNWNDQRGNTNKIGDAAAVEVIDDVGFLQALVADISVNYSVDEDRIYSTGISNGAFMTQRLACDAPGLLAAIAPVAGPMIEGMVDSCPQPSSVPVIGIQGTEDPFVPIEDGDGIPDMPRMLQRSGVPQTPMSLPEMFSFWTDVNGCSTNVSPQTIPDRVGDGTTVDVYQFNNCASGNPVSYYIVHGAGHSWPPATDVVSPRMVTMVGGVSSNIDANDVIWDFFAQHVQE